MSGRRDLGDHNSESPEWSATRFLRDPQFRKGYFDGKNRRPWPREIHPEYEAGRHHRANGGRLNVPSFNRSVAQLVIA